MDEDKFGHQLRTCLAGSGSQLYDFPQPRWGILAALRRLITGIPWYGIPGFGEASKRENASANDPDINDLDRRIEAVCALYAQADAGQRRIVRKKVGLNLAQSLLHFAWRKAVRVIRTVSSDDMKAGLLAVSLENERLDFRETICRLALLRHAAQRVGLDIELYFGEACAVSAPEMVQRIRDFLPQTGKYTDISQLGFREFSREFGITLERVF